MGFERATATLRALIRDERGNVLAMTAVGLPLLIGCAAIAVDTVQWVSAKRELQAAADAAAIAGVYGLVQTGEMDASVDDSVASNPKLDFKRSVSAKRSPAPYGDDPFAVRVRIASPVGMTFTKMFLSRAPTVDVEATATIVENGEFCAFAIGTEDETGLEIDPGANVEMECGMATNASSPKAIVGDGSAAIKADQIVAFGGIEANGIKDSRVRKYGLKQKDPLADRDPPLIPNTGCPNVTINSDAAVNLRCRSNQKVSAIDDIIAVREGDRSVEQQIAVAARRKRDPPAVLYCRV